MEKNNKLTYLLHCIYTKPGGHRLPSLLCAYSPASQVCRGLRLPGKEKKGGAVGGGRGWNDLHNKILTTQPQDTALLGGEPQYLYTTLYFRSLRCRAGSEDNNTPSSGTNVTNIINIFIALWQIFWKHLMWCNGDNLVVFYIWIVDIKHHHITNILNEFEKYLPLTLRYAS